MAFTQQPQEGELVIARERVSTGDFRSGEMEELPYADASFDVVTRKTANILQPLSQSWHAFHPHLLEQKGRSRSQNREK
jgi:hypothetical protein